MANRRQHTGRHLAHRCTFRPSDEIALGTGNAHVANAGEIFWTLDPFGDQRGIADFGQILHRPDKMVFDPVIGDAMDEMLVDLDVFGAQLGPHAQVGKTLAEIVDGDLEAAPAIVQQGLLDTRHIRDLLVLGQLDDDTVRGDAQFAEQLTRLTVHHPVIEQAARRDIDEQPASHAQRCKGAQTGFAAGMFQFKRTTGFAGGGEKPVRTMQLALFRAANQGFVTEDAAHA